jgi:hypothetical protein
VNLPTVDQGLAAARHIVSYAMGAATAFGVVKVQGVDLSVVSDSLNHIFNGVKEISLGLGPLVTIAMGWWATFKPSPAKQAASLGAGVIPGVKVIVSAAASPELKAVAMDPAVPNVSMAATPVPQQQMARGGM